MLDYAGEVASNVCGAAGVRLRSLTLGAKGLVLDSDRPTRFSGLLGSTSVISLDDIADDREKKFLMGVVIPWIKGAARLAGNTGGRLLHVFVVEEAHRVFEDIASRAPSAGGAPRGRFAAELAANLLSESRASGQCVVVVDQSPRKLIDDVIANTGTKIVFALPHEDDQRAIGAAMNLSDAQRRSLVALAPHQPLGFGTGMTGPVHVQTEPDAPPTSTRDPGPPPTSVRPGPPVEPDMTVALALLVALATGDIRLKAFARLVETAGAPWADIAVRWAVELAGRELRWTPAERDDLTSTLLDRSDPTCPPDRRPLPGRGRGGMPTTTSSLASQLVAIHQIMHEDDPATTRPVTADSIVPCDIGTDRLRTEVDRWLATNGRSHP